MATNGGTRKNPRSALRKDGSRGNVERKLGVEFEIVNDLAMSFGPLIT